jgi:hypothetical protein
MLWILIDVDSTIPPVVPVPSLYVLMHAPLAAWQLGDAPDSFYPLWHAVYVPFDFVIDDWAVPYDEPLHKAYCDYVDLLDDLWDDLGSSMHRRQLRSPGPARRE